MNRFRRQEAPWWHTLMLWEPGVPLVALCWGMACVTAWEIPMVVPEPLVFLVAFAWLFRLYPEPAALLAWEESARSRVARRLVTLTALLGSVLVLFCGVGAHFISFALMLLVPLIWSRLPFLSRIPGWYKFFHALMLALACFLPAAYLSMTVLPLEVFSYLPAWYLAFLIFLYYQVRSCWQMTGEPARRHQLAAGAALVLFCLLCLFTARGAASSADGFLFVTMALSAATLATLLFLRSRQGLEVLICLGWLALLLPPVLGVLFFA